jgi:hypothetical protein
MCTGETRNMSRIFVVKLMETTLGQPRNKWESNIKKDDRKQNVWISQDYVQ